MADRFNTFDTPKRPARAQRRWGFFSILFVFLLLGGGGFFIYRQLTSTAAQPAGAAPAALRDTDGDGLTDEQETRYGTDSAKTDSDNDRYSDYEEVTHGFDPLTPAASNVDQTAANTNTASGLPTTAVIPTLATAGWQTYNGNLRSANFSFSYPPAWQVQQTNDPTSQKLQLLDEQGDVAIRFSAAPGAGIDAAIIAFLKDAALTSDEVVTIGALPARSVVKTGAAGVVRSYLLSQSGITFQFEAVGASNDELQTVASSFAVTLAATAADNVPTLVYQIAEVKNQGITPFADDDTVEHRFVRVQPDGTQPAVIYTITKQNADGYGAPTATALDNNRLLLFRRTQSADDLLVLDLNGNELDGQGLPVQGDVLLSPTQQRVAYVQRDVDSGKSVLLIKRLPGGEVASIDASSVGGGQLRALAWSADEVFVYCVLQSDNERDPLLLYRADLTNNSIIEIPIVRELGIRQPHLLPELDLGVGSTSLWSGDPRVGRTPPSTLELLQLSKKTNRTLLQSESDVFGKTLLSPDGLWVAYEATRAGSTTVRLLALTGSGGTAETTQLPGKLLAWTTDSRYVVYQTAKQLRVFTPADNSDLVLATDAADNPTGADPYTIIFIGAFGGSE